MPDLDINIDDNVQLVELGLVFSTVESLGRLRQLVKVLDCKEPSRFLHTNVTQGKRVSLIIFCGQ